MSNSWGYHLGCCEALYYGDMVMHHGLVNYRSFSCLLLVLSPLPIHSFLYFCPFLSFNPLCFYHIFFYCYCCNLLLSISLIFSLISPPRFTMYLLYGIYNLLRCQHSQKITELTSDERRVSQSSYKKHNRLSLINPRNYVLSSLLFVQNRQERE